MKKIVVIILSTLLLVTTILPASAATYQYIYDNESLFDNSPDMLNMSKDIRHKLDFDVHIYSISSTEEADSIVNKNMQNASALLFFIDRNQNITWWSGSGVKKIIRDVDFEKLVSSIKLTPNQYTEPINYILASILNVFVYKTTSTPKPAETISPTNSYSNDPVDNIFNTIINYIRQHPIPIFLLLIALIAYVLYHRYHSEEK